MVTFYGYKQSITENESDKESPSFFNMLRTGTKGWSYRPFAKSIVTKHSGDKFDENADYNPNAFGSRDQAKEETEYKTQFF